MEVISIFDIILGNRFYGFIVLFTNSKDILSWLVIFGKLIENVLTTNNFGKFENLVHILGISKVFVKLLEIEPSFDFMLTVSSSCFYPWAMTCDYLARYYSLCDLGILALFFVMVISSGFVSAE